MRKNTDTFKKAYKSMSDENVRLILDMKNKAEELENLMLTINSREMSIALTNLEQSLMWATKAVCISDNDTENKQ